MSNISYHISFRVQQSTRTQAKYTVGLARISKGAHGGMGRPRYSLVPSDMIDDKLAYTVIFLLSQMFMPRSI